MWFSSLQFYVINFTLQISLYHCLSLFLSAMCPASSCTLASALLRFFSFHSVQRLFCLSTVSALKRQQHPNVLASPIQRCCNILLKRCPPRINVTKHLLRQFQYRTICTVKMRYTVNILSHSYLFYLHPSITPSFPCSPSTLDV